MRRTAITTTDTLASKFQSHADVEHARERIHQRSPDSLADFILSLAHAPGPVGDQVRTFIVGDDVPETVAAIRERIASLALPTDYAQRHAQGRQIGVSLELILDSSENLLLPADPAAAFSPLGAVFEADSMAMEHCGEHDWEVSSAYRRAAQLMQTAAAHLPTATVAETLRELISHDGYGVRAPLNSVLAALESP